MVGIRFKLFGGTKTTTILGGLLLEVEFKNGFRVISDSLQFVVQRKRIVKKTPKTKDENVGNIEWDNICYCRELDFALKSIGDQLVMDIPDIQDIKKALLSLEKEIAAFRQQLQVEVKFDEEN